MIFRFEDYKYTPAYIANASYKEVKQLTAEYRKLKRIIDRRLQTFERHGETEYKTYKYNKDKFKDVGDMKSLSELGRALSEAHKMLSAERSSYTAIKKIEKKSFKTLQKNFPTLIDDDMDREALYKFLNDAKEAHPSTAFDSEQALAIFAHLHRLSKPLDYEKIGHSFFNALYSKNPVDMTLDEVRQFDELFNTKSGNRSNSWAFRAKKRT